MSTALAAAVGLPALVAPSRAARQSTSTRAVVVRRSTGASVRIPAVRPRGSVLDRRPVRAPLASAPNALPIDALPAPALVADVADGLEGGIQAIYLGALLAILGFAGFIVVRQVLIRRELDKSAKNMGERIRAGDATAEEYFEMGSIMLRKKVFTQAVRNLKLAAQMWEGDKEDLAQIHNALGFGSLSTDKVDEAISEFNKAVELTPGYVTAWNNLGDALERRRIQGPSRLTRVWCWRPETRWRQTGWRRSSDASVVSTSCDDESERPRGGGRESGRERGR